MASVGKTIFVKAPIKEAYEWVEWAPNFIGVWPNLLKTVNYTRNEEGYGLHETIYMMAGMQIKVAAQDTVKIPYEKIVAESDGVLSSVVNWSFEETAGGTNLSLLIDYTVKFNVLRGFTEGIVVRLNESDLNVLMSNLKQKLEKLYQDRL